MRATWYVLEDGAPADPAEVSPGEDGRLMHTSGKAVAYGPHGPRSTGVDLPEEPVSAALEAEKPKRGYKTREIKDN